MNRVLITGGAAGIGLRLAERFKEAGAKVAVCDADPSAIEALKVKKSFDLASCVDVTDEAAMAAFLASVEAEFGGIDVVCANAGTGGPAGRIEDLDYAEWQRCVSVNLDGTFLTCRWAAKVMRKQKQGSIILTSSTAGQHGYPLRSPYAAAKWGIVGLTKTLAMELGQNGIRVNAICPGAVEGDRMERMIEREAAASGRNIDDVRSQYVRGVSMRTWVSTDDLADMVLFLSSPAASKVSGQIIAVDGNTETLST